MSSSSSGYSKQKPETMYEILFIPFTILLGLVTSFQDIKQGTIRNKWILLSIGYSIVIALILHNIASFADFSLNALMAFIYGLIIWHAGLWSAGDAKLYLAYSMLIPLSFYNTTSSPLVAPFILIINTFVPFFIYFIALALFRTTAKQKIASLKVALKPGNVLIVSLFILGFSPLITLIFDILKIKFNYFFMVLILFLILFLAEKVMRASLISISIALIILSAAFDPSAFFSKGHLLNMAGLIALFILFRYYFLTLAYNMYSHEIYIEDLKEGMIPAENIRGIGKDYKKESLLSFSIVESLIKNTSTDMLFGLVSEGLTKKQVKKVQDLHNEGIIKAHTIRIHQTVPFAPFMFAGVILTLLLRKTIFGLFFGV